jgi:glyoxylase-like metal-dependent hydrolase (beta-lactamase superfamily II)
VPAIRLVHHQIGKTAAKPGCPSRLVDPPTCNPWHFELPLTRALLTAVDEVAPGVEIRTVVTTHANGDHCWGNQLLPQAQVVGSSACGHGMAHEVQPAELAALSGSRSRARRWGTTCGGTSAGLTSRVLRCSHSKGHKANGHYR